MIRGLDPQFYIVEHVLTKYRLISFLARRMPLRYALLLKVGLLVGRFCAMTAALYETERVMAFMSSAVYIVTNAANTIVGDIRKMNRQRIQAGLFHSH